MKPLSRLALSAVLFVVTPVFASEGDNTPDSNSSLDNLKTYLLNLGQYLGYDLKTSPTQQQVSVSEALLQVTTNAIQQILLPSFQTVFGALPVTTAGIANIASGTEASPIFVPSNVQPYSQLNITANSTFNSSKYSTPAGTMISASPLVDQPNTGAGGQQYQNDPVSQAIANILTTPDYSYCLDNTGNNFVQCTYPAGLKNVNQVMLNVIGSIPDTQTFFTPAYNQAWIGQLNSNSLIAPLMYSSASTGNTPQGSTVVNTATGIPTQQGPQGPLQAQNSAQLAQNFIRYATSAVNPVPLPSRTAYDAVYGQTLAGNKTVSDVQRWQAASTLANYLTTLRVYTAQTSVGIGNLYYILSKRMPQPVVGQGSNASSTTSQALSEYTLATWRLFNPSPNANQGAKTEWLSKLDQASAATMQKEIAVLLAEINYQLYLNRQQEERLLFTNSMLLLQNARAAQPATNLTGASSDNVPPQQQ
jgi:intracellular multiplication protein IcmX